MEEDQNRFLLAATAIVALIGGVVIIALVVQRSASPKFGWAQMGKTEVFDLKPGGNNAFSFSYTELPERFKVVMDAQKPVSFGFVTPDTYGHFTHTILNLDFAKLPCGSVSTISASLDCTTQSSSRYLLFSDLREDTVPDPAPVRAGLKKNASPEPEPAPELNHVTVKMYEWRCVKHCGNLPPAVQ